MSKLRGSWTVLFATVALLAAAGVASADDDSASADDDTVLNIGYDDVNHVLIVNTSATDSTYDCSLQGPFRVGYGTFESGPILVESLEVKVEEGVFEAFMFNAREEAEVDLEKFTLAEEETIEYTGADEACGLSGGLVGGPNGQINHGQFMKLFHQLVDGQGPGCLNRLMAQSNLGKGDQQVRTSDLEPTDAEAEFEAATTGTVEFESFTTDCERGKKDKGGDHPGQSNRSNRSDSPGKSGTAKGHNK